MIKAIFFDVDGTLVSFNTHAIPTSALDALTAVKKKGIKIFIATGRALRQLNNLHGISFDGYITMNGAYCVNARHEIISKSIIPQEDVEALLRYQEEKGTFPVGFMTTEEETVSFINDKVIELFKLVNLPLPPVKSFREAVHDEILQMEIYTDGEQELEINQKVLVHCQATRWNPVFTDINLRGCNKQSGIDHILKYYDIPLGETMCFGDGGNDISMLRHAAVSVAMGNASDEVKRTAGYITDTVDNDGIWKALKHFGIIETH